MDKNLKFFAQKLKRIRKAKHLTLEKLSELARISPNHISKLEAAKTAPSFGLLTRLSAAMGIEIKDLFDFDDMKNTKTIRDDFLNTVENIDMKYLKILQKIYKDLTL